MILIMLLFASCKSNTKTVVKPQSIASFRFVGEKIIPANMLFEGTKIGGLSSIDYANGFYYLISDDKGSPVRIYEMELFFNESGIIDFKITNLIPFVTKKRVDPEALRYDVNSKHFFWTSEGLKYKKTQPSIYEIDKNGILVNEIPVLKQLEYDFVNKNNGARSNGTLEGLSMSIDSSFLWTTMELPLKQDGDEPKLKEGIYPIRISKINKSTGKLDFQFAYHLDAIPRDSNPPNKFTVNGVSEILEISKNQFLVIERAYAAGHNDGGNTIKIFKVDCSNATDISKIKSLKGASYVAATKKELLNFDSLRNKLTDGIIDNIEGVTFGPKLANGNRSLVLVSDNNFNKFSKQLNQIIVLEVLFGN